MCGGPESEFPIGLRVLAIVYDPTELQNLEDILIQCQYKVTTSTDGASAISLLQQWKGEFDLILCEVNMLDMNGLELLKRIQYEFGDIPLVILLSENDRPDMIWRCIKGGARTYLTKPINKEMLETIWLLVPRGEEKGTKENGDNEKKRKEKEEERKEELEKYSMVTNKKPRVVWTDDLHKIFLEAVNHLGIDKAVPKKILELMNTRGLTRENVASHLQKYRILQKRGREDARQNHERISRLRNVEHHLPPQSLRNLSSVPMNTQFHAYNSCTQFPNPSNMRAPPWPFNSAAQFPNPSNMRTPPLPFNSAAQLADSSNMRAPTLPFNSAAQLADSSNMRGPTLPFNSAAQLTDSSNMRAPPLPFNSAAQLAMQRVAFNQTNYIPNNVGMRPFGGAPPLMQYQNRTDQYFNLPSSQENGGFVFPEDSIDGPSVSNHPGEQQQQQQQQDEASDDGHLHILEPEV